MDDEPGARVSVGIGLNSLSAELSLEASEMVDVDSKLGDFDSPKLVEPAKELDPMKMVEPDSAAVRATFEGVATGSS